MVALIVDSRERAASQRGCAAPAFRSSSRRWLPATTTSGVILIERKSAIDLAVAIMDGGRFGQAEGSTPPPSIRCCSAQLARVVRSFRVDTAAQRGP